MTITEGDWAYTLDSYGDWRGINETLGRRTRLKRELTKAQQDVAIGRLQTRAADGTWIDRIDKYA